MMKIANVWIASLAVVMIATMLLSAASPNSAANAQQVPPLTEVKIDNFSFGPATVTVAVGTTVTWTNRDDIPHTWSAPMTRRHLSPRCWIRMTSSLTPSPNPEPIPISARFTRK